MSLELPREPERGEPIAAHDMASLIRYVRAITPRGGPGIRVNTLPSGTVIAATTRHGPLEDFAGGRPAWHCELVAGNDNPVVRVYPGPREVVGGWAEWCAPASGDYWALDTPATGDWCVAVRYKHPTPNWENGGIIAGAWVKSAAEAPEIIDAGPGPDGVCDNAEHRVFVLAAYWPWHAFFGANVFRQFHTGMLAALPVLDRAACLPPPEP